MDTKDKLVTLEDLKVVHDGVDALETRMESAESEISDTVKKSTGGTFSGDVTVDKADGTSSVEGWSSLILGNNKAAGTAGNSGGDLQIFGRTAYKTEIIHRPSSPTANRVIYIPDADGTIALSELTLPKATILLNSNHDLNNLKNDSDNGLYGITTGVANSPTTWATLLVIAGGAGVSQIIFKANQIYTRMYTGSPISWSAWFPYYPGKSFRIENPWESLDTNKCSLYESDNFLYVNGNIVYFSIRFVMKVATTGNLSILKLKSAYDAYKPIMYSLNNGGVYFAHRTWSPDGGIQVFFGTNVGNVGVGTGAIANQGYIVQGMYFIA